MFREERGTGRVLAVAKQKGKGGWRLCVNEEKLKTWVKEERG